MGHEYALNPGLARRSTVAAVTETKGGDQRQRVADVIRRTGRLTALPDRSIALLDHRCKTDNLHHYKLQRPKEGTSDDCNY
jgi:hypothetical protein